jgi:hypothetical protein
VRTRVAVLFFKIKMMWTQAVNPSIEPNTIAKGRPGTKRDRRRMERPQFAGPKSCNPERDTARNALHRRPEQR